MEHVIYQVGFVLGSDATYSKFSKVLIAFLFRFSIEMLVIRAGCHKMLVRITNNEILVRQKQSDLGLCCLSTPFLATNIQYFRTFIVSEYMIRRDCGFWLPE